MDLKEFTGGTKDNKPWLTIVAKSLNAETVTADNFVGPISGNSITLAEQASVPDPAVGKLTLFANLSGQVSTTNSLGDTITLLDNPASQDEDMNSHNIINVLNLAGPANSRLADNIVSNSAPVSSTSNIAVFSDGTGLIIQDSHVNISHVVTNTTSAVSGNLAAFNGTSGIAIQDSGIAGSGVIVNPLTADLNANNHNITNIKQLTFQAGILAGSGPPLAGDSSAIAIGNSSNASGTGGSVALGPSAQATGNTSTAIGANAQAHGTGSLAINGTANAPSATAVGPGANAGTFASAFGVGAGAAGNNAVAVGNGASAAGLDATAVGTNSVCSNNFGVALANGATSSAQAAIAIGNGATASALDSIVIGDGTSNGTAHSALIGDAAIVNIRSGSSTNACDLGTSAAPFKTCWVKDASPAVGSHYTMYSAVTLANTTTETSLLTGTSAGSLVWSAGQALGSTINIRLNIAYSGLVTDSLTFRYKVNGTTVLTQVIGAVALSAVGGMSLAEFVVQASTVQSSVSTSVNGLVGEVTNASAAYNPAIANTFSLTGQWSGAGAPSASDSITVNYAFATTVYAL